MEDKICDLGQPKGVKEKKLEVIDGYTIKYHANGATVWSKGKMVDDQHGTIKRSGHFEKGEPVGEWVTYDDKGKKYKTTNRGKK